MAHSEIIFVQITLQMLKRIQLIEFSLNPLLETGEMSVEMFPSVMDS